MTIPTQDPAHDTTVNAGPSLADAAKASLHPDCPDMRKLGPNPREAYVRAAAARVEADEQARDAAWSRGCTRRRFVAGAGMVGVAALGTQLVTTRVSFAAKKDTGTLVVIFLRGGADGLSMVVPAGDKDLLKVRPGIGIKEGALLPLADGWGLHPALKPIHGLWKKGLMTAVPAVSTPDLSRSHFQAQDCLEAGGSATAAGQSGWLDRVLEQDGPGTTFRAVAEGSRIPRSLSGSNGALAFPNVEAFRLNGWDETHDKTKAAYKKLYTGFEHPVTTQVDTALAALSTAEKIAAKPYQPATKYPDGYVADAFKDLARLIKAKVGLRVACVDVGGWDMHTGLGTVDNGDMKTVLGQLATALDAFTSDLGGALDHTTILTMTEFGRRVEQNASGGTDHGHGALGLVLGGGVAGGAVHGKWHGLDPKVLDQGDVPGTNDYRDLLGDVVGGRLGLSAGQLAKVFPGHKLKSLGVMK